MAKRRQPVNTITAHVAIMQAAANEISPPAHLPLAEKDLPFWFTVIAEKPKSEWTAHDLEMAVMLATSMRKLNEQEEMLDQEGPVYTTGGGNMAQNPRCRIVADLAARVVKYRQTLGIHNRAKQGEARDVARRRAQALDVEANNPLDDGLIARPDMMQ
jgi:hypothetical protein